VIVLVLGGVVAAAASQAYADGSATDLIVPPGRDAVALRDAVRGALALLPRMPARVAVMDVSEATPEVRDRLLRLDAFTVRGNAVIYLVAQSDLLKGAQAGSAFHRAALAAVIWHEMTHLSGGDEHQARNAEATLWTRFVRDGATDQVTGLRYLRALEQRPDDTLMASR
jgi:hypothetical protein